jgi:hypothetical protein
LSFSYFNFNFSLITIKYDSLKNNINYIISHINNNILFKEKNLPNIKNNNTLYTEYKKFFIKGRKGNLVGRGIQFIIDFSLLIKNKIYP